MRGSRRRLVVPLQLDDGAACGIDLHSDLVAASVSALDLPDAVLQLDSVIITMPLSKAMARTSSTLTDPAAAGMTRARLTARNAGMKRIERTFLG